MGSNGTPVGRENVPQSIFGYAFKNKALLEEALTTPSYKMTRPDARDNQRLEFLGDAVLGLIASDWLYARNPGDEEGALTSRRQKMVSSSALCEAAERADLKAVLKRNRGAEPLPAHSKTFADAVEAVIGAAWLDGGLEAARKVFDGLGVALEPSKAETNPKSVLQHITQAMRPAKTPSYRVLSARGTCDKPVFTVEAEVEGVGRATGSAGSIKEAETKAAAKLISVFFP